MPSSEPTPPDPTPLAREFLAHPERRYVMFGGKGGLGKTTFSAATALWLAEQGHKVLVFSVDPQASLSDIFQRDIFGKGAVQVAGGDMAGGAATAGSLWAQEIDADAHIKAYQDEIRQRILEVNKIDKVPDEIEDYIAAASAEPAMEESAIFDAVVDIVSAGDFDYYVYDLVPLGHALYYLSMAKVYDEWITKITRLREEMREYEEMVSRLRREKETQEDEILAELQDIRSRINTASSVLTDRDHTAFFFVLVPEEMILLDTAKAAAMFARFDVPIAGYVVNRVLPAELLEADGVPGYLVNRAEMQRGHLDRIGRDFGDDVLGHVPELERDVTGLAMIERMARLMYGGPVEAAPAAPADAAGEGGAGA
jgi:arsenite/tail-anchored protein-transporting ATPase